MKKYAAIFLLLLITLLSLSVHAASFIFTDVVENIWYYNDVKTAYESGLINGSTPTEFSPDANLTCAEAVKLAACMHQLYIEGKVTLTNGDPWYQPYIDYAQDNEILQYQNILDPEAPINRGEFIEIFAKALPEEALPAINDIPDGIIRDVPMSYINSKPVYQMYRAGIIQGSGRTHSFYPSRYITRGEVATILTRMMYADTRISFTLKLSENTEYKAAYAEFLTTYADLYGEDGKEYMFDLIYTGGTGIPELIVTEKSSLERKNGVRVYRYIVDHVTNIGTFGEDGAMTYLPNHGTLWDSITSETSDGWITYTALKTPNSPPETTLSLQKFVNLQNQTTEYRMFHYGDTEWTTLTKEEYTAQYQALEDFMKTEAISVYSQRMYELNEENIAKVLG